MHERTIARVYAETLLEVARGRGKVDVMAEEAVAFREALRSDLELRLFLETPRIASHVKQETLRKSLRGRVSDEMLRFLEVTVEREREGILDEIFAEFAWLVQELRNQLPVTVTTPRPLAPPVRVRLQTILAAATRREVILRERLDPSLLGSLVVQVGDARIDGSIRTRLDNLRDRLRQAGAAATNGRGSPGARRPSGATTDQSITP